MNADQLRCSGAQLQVLTVELLQKVNIMIFRVLFIWLVHSKNVKKRQQLKKVFGPVSHQYIIHYSFCITVGLDIGLEFKCRYFGLDW